MGRHLGGNNKQAKSQGWFCTQGECKEEPRRVLGVEPTKQAEKEQPEEWEARGWDALAAKGTGRLAGPLLQWSNRRLKGVC